MPRAPADNSRVELPLRPDDRATLTRAALSERVSLRVLALFENPPAANARLVCTARAGFVLPDDAFKRGR